MDSYKEKLKSRRSMKAMVAKVEIPGAILWVRKHGTGSVSVWPQPKKGQYTREAKPILQMWASMIGAQQSELTWWVHPNQASLALKTVFRLEGAKINELNLRKLGLTALALPLSYWTGKLRKIHALKPH